MIRGESRVWGHDMKKSRNERGASVVLVAGSLLLLMGMASLAIDGGFAFNERRGTQNAADLAALAAAWQDCNPESGVPNPTAAARQTAAANGYTHTPGGFPQVLVSSTGNNWTVRIIEENPTTFGRATPYAPDDLRVDSEATATCFDTGLFGGMAVFGKADACPGIGGDVNLSSSDVYIDGGVHSNGDLKISGSSPVVTGEATYRGSDNTAASITAQKYFGSPLDYPVDLDIAEYRPGGSRANAADATNDYHAFPGNAGAPAFAGIGGNVRAAGTLTIREPGIYYAAGNIQLGSVSVILEGAAAAQGITLVAEGTIDLKSIDNVKGYDPLVPGGSFPVLMMSNAGSQRCNDVAISVSGNNVTWNGLIFAPNGGVTISSAAVSTVDLDGSIIAYTVRLSGGAINISYEDDPAADPNYLVELID